MNVTVNPVDQHKVTLTIEVPAADVEKVLRQPLNGLLLQPISQVSVKVKRLVAL